MSLKRGCPPATGFASQCLVALPQDTSRCPHPGLQVCSGLSDGGGGVGGGVGGGRLTHCRSCLVNGNGGGGEMGGRTEGEGMEGVQGEIEVNK